MCVDTSTEAVWLIMKRDLFYKPNGSGYTGVRKNAGRYTLPETAVRFPNHDEHGASFIHEDDAPEFSKACYEDVKLDVLAAERDTLRQQLAEARDCVASLLARIDDTFEAENPGALTMHTYGQSPDWFVAAAMISCGITIGDT